MKKHCLVLPIHLSILLLFSAMPVLAELPPETRWADPSSVRLDVEFPGNGYHATWDLHRCDCGDLLVRSELSVPGETETGETLLVAGRAILSRGFGQHQEELGASLDAPALMMQLTLRLLERASPAGPSAIGEATDWVEIYNGSTSTWTAEAQPAVLSPRGRCAGTFSRWVTASAVSICSSGSAPEIPVKSLRVPCDCPAWRNMPTRNFHWRLQARSRAGSSIGVMRQILQQVWLIKPTLLKS